MACGANQGSEHMLTYVEWNSYQQFLIEHVSNYNNKVTYVNLTSVNGRPFFLVSSGSTWLRFHKKRIWCTVNQIFRVHILSMAIGLIIQNADLYRNIKSVCFASPPCDGCVWFIWSHLPLKFSTRFTRKYNYILIWGQFRYHGLN